MKDEIIEEIMRECKDWKERLLVKLFSDTYIKAYNIGRINTLNAIIKK